MDILYDTATTASGLETETNISAKELTVLHKDVTNTTTHLRSYDEASMSGKNSTSADDYILAGATTTTTVLILSALDADAIIARIELRINDESILTRFQV